MLRIMSFNVRGDWGTDNEVNCWPNRAPFNVAVIREQVPDLLGLQEAQTAHLVTYLQHLPEYGYLSGPPVSNDRIPIWEHVALFWRRDRLDLMDAGSFYLSEDPDRYYRSWESNNVRGANWARLRDRQKGRELIFLNTHLDHISPLARTEGAKLILAQLEEINRDRVPVIMTGDFNADGPALPEAESAPPHQTFVQAGYVDAFLAGGAPGPVNTFHGFRGIEIGPGPGRNGRIDWILVHPGGQRAQIHRYQVVRTARPPLYPSDHYPVVADLTFMD